MQDSNPTINTESNEGWQTQVMHMHILQAYAHLQSTEMDIDTSKASGSGSSKRSGRIQKRQRKNRSSIVFKPHPSKTRKISKKK
jgi:hypothetical protein